MADYSLLTLTTYVRPETASAFKRHARRLGMSSSACLRQLVERDLVAPEDDHLAVLTRHIIFVSVAVDALLDAHPDRTLRSRVHQVYQRRLQPQETSGDV